MREDTVRVQYTCELDLFRKVRSASDGITFFELGLNLDRYPGDHKPSFTVMLVICNWKVFEFSVYNIYHLDRPEWEVRG